MRKPLIGAKGFRSFDWTRGTSSRDHGGSPRKRAFVCMGERKRKKKRRMKWEKGC